MYSFNLTDPIVLKIKPKLIQVISLRVLEQTFEESFSLCRGNLNLSFYKDDFEFSLDYYSDFIELWLPSSLSDTDIENNLHPLILGFDGIDQVKRRNLLYEALKEFQLKFARHVQLQS